MRIVACKKRIQHQQAHLFCFVLFLGNSAAIFQPQLPSAAIRMPPLAPMPSCVQQGVAHGVSGRPLLLLGLLLLVSLPAGSNGLPATKTKIAHAHAAKKNAPCESETR